MAGRPPVCCCARACQVFAERLQENRRGHTMPTCAATVKMRLSEPSTISFEAIVFSTACTHTRGQHGPANDARCPAAHGKTFKRRREKRCVPVRRHPCTSSRSWSCAREELDREVTLHRPKQCAHEQRTDIGNHLRRVCARPVAAHAVLCSGPPSGVQA